MIRMRGRNASSSPVSIIRRQRGFLAFPLFSLLLLLQDSLVHAWQSSDRMRRPGAISSSLPRRLPSLVAPRHDVVVPMRHLQPTLYHHHFLSSSQNTLASTQLRHHPSLHAPASPETSPRSSIMPSPPVVIRRNAVIRVTLATLAMFLIATVVGNNTNHTTRTTTMGMKVGVSLALGAFLAVIERSRRWIAQTRMRATEVWQSAHAHYSLSTALQQSSSNDSKQPSSSLAALPSNKSNSKANVDWTKARAGERITLIGTAVNIGLTIFKLIAGVVGKSSAMVADAGHSLSDLASDVVTLYTVRIASLPADEDHPYGHERFEALGSLAVAGMLTTAALGFGTYAYESFVSLLTSSTSATASSIVTSTSRIALLAAVVSIVSKELLYRATAIVAQQTESQVLLANAWHHRSDAFSSIVALVSIWGATMPGGIPALDPLGGLCVAGMVGITGLRVGWSAVLQLTDTQDLELKRSIEKTVDRAIVKYQLQDDLVDKPSVRTRFLGSRSWVDLTVEMNPLRSASATTQVVKVLRNAILSRQPSVNDVAVVLKTHDDDDDDAVDSTVVVPRSSSEAVVATSTGRVNEEGAEMSSTKDDITTKPLDTVTLTPLQVEESVRRTLRQSLAFQPVMPTAKRLKDVSHVLVHFSPSSSAQEDRSCGQCDVDIIVSADADMSVLEARELAETVKLDVIEHTEGVTDAKVSLELVV